MSMSKKDFFALADVIRSKQEFNDANFNQFQLDALADFCEKQNHNFMRKRWFDYINGKCGKNGGKVKSN